MSLSDNYRAQQQDEKALEVLNRAIENDSTSAQLYYSKALTLVRIGNKNEAANAIEKATKYAPDNSYYWYLNGVLQEPIDVAKATDSFEKAYLISGAPDSSTRFAIFMYELDTQKQTRAWPNCKK